MKKPTTSIVIIEDGTIRTHKSIKGTRDTALKFAHNASTFLTNGITVPTISISEHLDKYRCTYPQLSGIPLAYSLQDIDWTGLQTIYREVMDNVVKMSAIPTNKRKQNLCHTQITPENIYIANKHLVGFNNPTEIKPARIEQIIATVLLGYKDCLNRMQAPKTWPMARNQMMDILARDKVTANPTLIKWFMLQQKLQNIGK